MKSQSAATSLCCVFAFSYLFPDCRKKHWPEHKPACKQARAEKKAAEAELSGKGDGDLLRRCGACGKANAPKKCEACRLQWYCDKGSRPGDL